MFKLQSGSSFQLQEILNEGNEKEERRKDPIKKEI